MNKLLINRPYHRRLRLSSLYSPILLIILSGLLTPKNQTHWHHQWFIVIFSLVMLSSREIVQYTKLIQLFKNQRI